MANRMVNVYLYSRYERFWHWFQTLLIIVLLITGLETHGFYTLLGFEMAVEVHNLAGLTWLIAFAFFVFWIFTTNEWKHYIPTTKKMVAVVRHYVYGIFHGEPHPVPKRRNAKHNPLQRLVYLGLAMILLPVQMITGFLYWGYNSWADWGVEWLSLEVIGVIHMIGAFAIFSFIIVHVYMTTTGETVTAHLKAMITGWEDVEEGVEIEDWERADQKDDSCQEVTA